MYRSVFVTVFWAVMMSGCQAYHPAPLQLEDYGAQLDARLRDVEPVTAFARRLSAAGEVPVTFDAADGLGCAEGEVVALWFNPALRRARAEAEVSGVSAVHAGAWQDPVFAFNGAEILSSDGPFQFGLGLEFTLPVSGRLEVERDRAAASYRAALQAIVADEWALRMEVRRAWARWSATREREALQVANLDALDALAALVGNLEELGELSRLEARLVYIERELQAAALASTRREGMSAHASLLELLGLPAGTVELVPSLVVAEGAADASDARIIAHNTEVAVARAAYEVAEESLRLEIRRQYPDITIGGGYGEEDDRRLLLGLSVPIPVLNGNRPAIAIAEAERRAARARVETAFEEARHALLVALAKQEAVAVELDHFETAVLPLLHAQRHELEGLVALGEFDVLLFLETIGRDVAARNDLLDLRINAVSTAADVRQLLGPDGDQPAPVQEATP